MCDVLNFAAASAPRLNVVVETWRCHVPISTSIVLLLLALAACNLSAFRPTPTPTPELPTVEFLTPINTSTVLEGTDLPIDLVARYSGGVARIELLVDERKINEITPQTGAPVPVFRVQMNWLARGLGHHSLSAIAYSADGKASSPTIISIEVLPRS